MAVKFIDGFEAYGATNGNNVTGLQAKWGNAQPDSNFTIQAGRTGGKCVRCGLGKYFTSPNIGNQGTIIVGFGFYQDAFQTAQDILYFFDSATKQITVAIQTSGAMKVYRGSSLGTLLGTTSGTNVSASTWVYVEIKIKFHGSTGTVDVHFDGTSVLSLTGQNTSQSGNAQASQVQFIGSNNGADHTQFDDLYICDTTGSVNTDFLGAQKIVLVQPSGDAGTNQFTTSSGSTHYNRVSDNPDDADSTYLEDSTSGHQELFNYGAIAGLATVTALQINTVARLTDTTPVSVKNSIKSGATSSDDTAQTVSGTDYQTKVRCVETDPNTGAAWTVPNVNAATFGFKVG